MAVHFETTRLPGGFLETSLTHPSRSLMLSSTMTPDVMSQPLQADVSTQWTAAQTMRPTSLLGLPNELIEIITDYTNDQSSILALSRTCWRLHGATEKALYRCLSLRTTGQVMSLRSSLAKSPERVRHINSITANREDDQHDGLDGLAYVISLATNLTEVKLKTLSRNYNCTRPSDPKPWLWSTGAVLKVIVPSELSASTFVGVNQVPSLRHCKFEQTSYRPCAQCIACECLISHPRS